MGGRIVRPVVGFRAVLTGQRATLREAQNAIQAFVERQSRWRLVASCDDPWDLVAAIDRTGAKQVVVAALGAEQIEDPLKSLPTDVRVRLQAHGVSIVAIDRAAEQARKQATRREAQLRSKEEGQIRCIRCGGQSLREATTPKNLRVLRARFRKVFPERAVEGDCSLLCWRRAMAQVGTAERAATEQARLNDERRRRSVYIKVTSAGGFESNRGRH